MEKKKIKTVQLAPSDGRRDQPLTGEYAGRPASNAYADRPGGSDYATIKTQLADTPSLPTLVVNTTYGDDDGGASPRLQNPGKGDSSPLGLPSPEGGAERVVSPPER